MADSVSSLRAVRLEGPGVASVRALDGAVACTLRAKDDLHAAAREVRDAGGPAGIRPVSKKFGWSKSYYARCLDFEARDCQPPAYMARTLREYAKFLRDCVRFGVAV